MEEKRLAKLYNALKAQNYDVPNSYDEFEEKLTRKGDDGASRRHKLYDALKSQGFDVPDVLEDPTRTELVQASCPNVLCSGGRHAFSQTGFSTLLFLESRFEVVCLQLFTVKT